MIPFRKKSEQLPEDLIVYAVGDIHGRADLLDELLRLLDADWSETGGDKDVSLVFLGDYVDRGPDSKAVIDRVLQVAASTGDVRCLMGNHEEALLNFLQEPQFGETWAGVGGVETLASYGVSAGGGEADWEAARDEFAARLPAEHLEFLRALSLQETIGPYHFVHAGVRPGVPLDRQTPRDLLWIRDEFLTSSARLDKTIVHGHTPESEPVASRRRIGVDTGAYITGRLTAARLERGSVRFVSTG